MDALALDRFVDSIIEGRRDRTAAGALLEAIGPGLVALGLPLWRASSNIETLHPEVIATTTAWYRDAGRAEVTRWPRTFARTVEEVRSPLRDAFAAETTWRRRLDRSPDLESYPLLAEFRARGATDYLVCPLRFTRGRFNALSWATDRPGGLAPDEVLALEGIGRRLAPVFEVLALRETEVTLLDTYLGRRTGSRVLRDGLIGRGAGESIEAVVWCSDLRDSTALAEALPPDELLALLNGHFDRVTDAIEAKGGEVLKFVGDGVIAMFPLDAARAAAGRRETCRAALAAALDAGSRMAGLNREREAAGRDPVRFGVALHVGGVVYGNVGAARRLDFTAIGPAVNLASRIEGMNAELGTWLLTSAAFAAAADRPLLRSLGRFELRGAGGRHELYTLAPAAAAAPLTDL